MKPIKQLEEDLTEAHMSDLLVKLSCNKNTIYMEFHDTDNVQHTVKMLADHIQKTYGPIKFVQYSNESQRPYMEIHHYAHFMLQKRLLEDEEKL